MDEYTTWTVGEIFDSMIRIRVKGDLSFAEKKEYDNLVVEIDRRFAFLMPEEEELETEAGDATETAPETEESVSDAPESPPEAPGTDEENAG
ncbi:MAG: hypothetical protein E3J72_02510 [Planctomycetota bacterium]|nr:MAG: hypothetical protein E3J72_02510 [Planctomycetota bacterium]